MEYNDLLKKILPAAIHEKIEGRHGLVKIIKNLNWLFFEKIIKMSFGFFIGMYEARYLGPEQYGIMNYAFSFVLMLSPLASLGMEGIMVRNFARNPDKENVYMGSAFLLKLFGGISLLLLAMIGIYIVRPDDSLIQLFVLIIAVGYLAKPFDVIDLWFQSQIQSKYPVFSRTISFMLVYGLKLLFILTKGPLIGFIWMFTLDLIIMSIGYIWFYWRSNHLRIRDWKISKPIMKEIMIDAWPMIFSGSAVIVMSSIDQIMIGEMLSTQELGQYALARRINDAFCFLPMIFVTTFAPTITKAKLEGETIYHNRLLRVYQIMFYLSLLVCVPTMLLSIKGVPFLMGQQYTEAGMLLIFMTLRFFFAAYGSARGLFITNESLFKYAMWTLLIGAVVNIGLNILLIPILKSLGAILATLISYVISIIIVDFFYTPAKANGKLMMQSIFGVKHHVDFFKSVFK